jgi:hypothetical protein
VSPYQFFRPFLDKTDDFDKFNREALSVEPTYPQKFRSFSSFLEILILKTSPNILYDILHPLGSQKDDYVTSRAPPVRPMMRTGQTGAPLRKRF